MLITSNSSPASGELLEDGATIEMMDLASHVVPESSHTIEIQYITETTLVDDYTNGLSPEGSHNDEDDFADELYSPGSGGSSSSSSSASSSSICCRRNSTNNNNNNNPSNVEQRPDEDLTNLNWLQNITNIMPVPSLAAISPKPAPPPPPKPLIKNGRLHKFKKTILKCEEDFALNHEAYRRDAADKKPPYSYCSLICLAMRHNGNKMTLAAIYGWIKENFRYYRQADPTWQNSIRHNLSLNKVFVKVARLKHEPGKGGFWKLDLARLEDSKKHKRALNAPRAPRKPKQQQQQQKTSGSKSASSGCDSGGKATDDYELFEATKRATDSIALHDEDVDLTMPDDFSLDGLDMVLSSSSSSSASAVGPNVIVEPVATAADEELGALLLSAPWEDLQTDLSDSLFDSYLK